MYLEDEELEEGEQREEELPEGDDEEYGTLEEEETLQELDFDERGHIRPRRKSRADDEEEIDPEY